MEDPLGRWCIIIFCSLLSALLTACETALKNANEDKLSQGAGERLRAYVRNKRRPISSLQTARLFLGLAVFYALSCFFQSPGWWAALLCAGTAVFLHTFCFALPSGIAKRNPERTLLRLRALLLITCVLSASFTFVFTWISDRLLSLAGVEADKKDEVTEEEIKQLVEFGEETGVLEQSEHEMIDNVLEFNDLTAADCMTHRTDVTALRVHDSQEVILKTIQETGLSRFPVYEKDIDDIIGILTARDYLINLNLSKPKSLKELLRKPYMVPETVKTDVLLRNMQRAKTHLAIVVDEYGGVSGIITMEDLLEEIVGNIYDEYDAPDEADFIKTGDDTWEVSGAADLDALAEEMQVTLPEEEYDTFGGLVFSRFGVIPADGATPEADIWCTETGEPPEPSEDEDEPVYADLMHVQVHKIMDRRVEKATATIRRHLTVTGEGVPSNLSKEVSEGERP